MLGLSTFNINNLQLILEKEPDSSVPKQLDLIFYPFIVKILSKTKALFNDQNCRTTSMVNNSQKIKNNISTHSYSILNVK